MINNERIILNLRHKHINRINMYYSEIFFHSIYVSDYMVNRDLRFFTNQLYSQKILQISNKSYFRMNENLIRYFAKQLVELLYFLHQNDIVHNNMKPDHLLINSYFQIKLTDFSCSKINNQDMFIISKNVTIDQNYMPHEYFNQSSILNVDAHKIDLYSVGCILYFLATNKDLKKFDQNEYPSLLVNLKNELEFNYSIDFIELIHSIN